MIYATIAIRYMYIYILTSHVIYILYTSYVYVLTLSKYPVWLCTTDCNYSVHVPMYRSSMYMYIPRYATVNIRYDLWLHIHVHTSYARSQDSHPWPSNNVLNLPNIYKSLSSTTTKKQIPLGNAIKHNRFHNPMR